MEDIASRLKRVRGKRSAKDFAALIGCSMQTIYRYEWGSVSLMITFSKRWRKKQAHH